MIETNIIFAIGIVAAVILFTRVIMPFLKERNLDIYQEVKLALLLMGYSFRDEKIKAMTGIVLGLVQDLEKIAIAPEDKLKVAVAEISKKLLSDFGLVLEEEAIELIIGVAVSTLPPTSHLNGNKLLQV